MIEGVCKEVIDKSEWVAIATNGKEGPHLVGTWGDYLKALGVTDETILMPARRMRIDGRPHFAKPSIGVGEKVKIAAIDPEFELRPQPPSLMECADRLPKRTAEGKFQRYPNTHFKGM